MDDQAKLCENYEEILVTEMKNYNQIIQEKKTDELKTLIFRMKLKAEEIHKKIENLDTLQMKDHPERNRKKLIIQNLQNILNKFDESIKLYSNDS